MSELEELAQREAAILASATRIVGLMEVKDEQLRSSGVYAEAAAIHAAYVDMAQPPESDVEALKRAVFLGWYQDAEPGCFTGVADLDDRQIRQSLELVEAAHSSGVVDGEFEAMLGWYWYVADWHFSERSSPALLDYLSGLDTAAYKSCDSLRSGSESRGQMGRYWASVTAPRA